MTKQLKKFDHDEEAVKSLRHSLNVANSRQIKDDFVPSLDYFPNPLVAQFIRLPSTYTPKIKSKDFIRNLIELAKYCYGKYKVPQFLDRCWSEVYDVTQKNYDRSYYIHRNTPIDSSLYNWTPKLITKNELYPYRTWWMAIALGKSLYKEYCKSFMTKKEVHTFINCKQDITLNEAMIYSVATCYGASLGNALRIAKSKLNEKRLDNRHDSKFWREVIQFFCMNEAESPQQINDLCDYFAYKFGENNNYTILGQGFTIKSLTEKMKSWHYDLRRIKEMGNEVWVGDTNISEETYKSKDQYDCEILWDFKQIKSAKELAKEGNAMHHCVASYKTLCIRGECSIWTLKSLSQFGEFKNHLTIEVRGNRIAQARGFANRTPKTDELKYLRLWALKNNLSMNSMY